ncbi:MAG: UDP-N-acetylmuramyl-tripeptide synthetase [Candidatus Peribacteraceae bacterium]|nr:UDP-N-acetylmuramyl-tripeptide synthetase [Candidatus Peribacteraceae bacterium]
MKKILNALIPNTHPIRLGYHRAKGSLAALKAKYPASKLRVIAITGTDGKTSTVAMTTHILAAAGLKVGAASTAFLQIGNKREPNATQKTSLTADHMQSFLNRLITEHCEFAVLEVSSHGLMQGRFNGITPEVAAITNISLEHLDYHGTMSEYILAKAMLFHRLRGRGTKVLNGDDQTFAPYANIPSSKTIIFSPTSQLTSIIAGTSSTTATATIDGKQYSLVLPIPGVFNLYNALCAIACAQAVGVDPAVSIKALASFAGAPGRMQQIDVGQPFSVYVDFTVTPIAYERTLTSLRAALTPGGRLLVLTGSCGDRMPEKRPLVGKICSELADIMVVSNEDPYTEDPEKIIDEVLSGVKNQPIIVGAKNYHSSNAKACVRISDRLEAIRFLLSQAKFGDIILFSGKGGDITMMTKNGQIPWDEVKIVTDELRSENQEDRSKN